VWRPAVIVIGAGAAGLAAARALSRGGLAVQILEARQRIGGRIHTLYDPLSPVPVELGAEFLHGKPPEIFDEIEAGRLSALEVEGEAHSADGQPEREENDGGEDNGGEEPLASLMPLLETAPEQTFAEFIARADVSEPVRRRATGYVEGFNAARAGRISVRGLVRMEKAAAAIEGDRAFRLSRGYGALAEWLWAGM